jgi:hypothetical protein
MRLLILMLSPATPNGYSTDLRAGPACRPRNRRDGQDLVYSGRERDLLRPGEGVVRHKKCEDQSFQVRRPEMERAEDSIIACMISCRRRVAGSIWEAKPTQKIKNTVSTLPFSTLTLSDSGVTLKSLGRPLNEPRFNGDF